MHHIKELSAQRCLGKQTYDFTFMQAVGLAELRTSSLFMCGVKTWKV